jgi:hypothetical protein
VDISFLSRARDKYFFGFASHSVSAATTQLCPLIKRAVTAVLNKAA